MSYLAHKRFVVKLKGIAQEDGFLATMVSDHTPVKKGDYILTDEYGIDFRVSGREYKENYIKVEKVKTENKLSNFNYDQIAQGYAAMAGMKQEEDQDYIDKLKDMVSGKPL